MPHAEARSSAEGSTQVFGGLDRAKLSPNFDTYKLSPVPLFSVCSDLQLSGGGARESSTQGVAGLDFATASFRLRFNDLQPDWSAPQNAWLFVGKDSTLRRLRLEENNGNAKLSESVVHSFAPPLRSGEIVTAVADASLFVIARQGGELLLCSRESPDGRAELHTRFQLSSFGQKCEQLSHADTHTPDAPQQAEQKGEEPGTEQKGGDEPGEEAAASQKGAEGEEKDCQTSYHVIDAVTDETGGAVCVLVGVMCKGAEGEGRSAAKLQVLQLESEGGEWRASQSIGLHTSGTLPRYARLHPRRPSVILVANHQPPPTLLPLNGSPSRPLAEEREGENDEEDPRAPVFVSVCSFAAVQDQGSWNCLSYKLRDGSGDHFCIGIGGFPLQRTELPMIGVQCRSGLGMYDMHAITCTPELDDSAPLTLTHAASFPAVGYIQSGRDDVKEVTFGPDLGTAWVVDSAETLHAYNRPDPPTRTAPQSILSAGEDAVILGSRALPARLLLLTPDRAQLLQGQSLPVSEAEEPDAPAPDFSQVELPGGFRIPEHLLEDW